ncbi:MAG: DUF4145 domain-containing protein [Candidatus Omnitrophota bacterium]|nr:MAG: DUF4145 domain-containing protein [Candidatus Omnitrophota bacterium]
MQSLNFEYLRPKRPELAELGAFAEQYASSDPSSALVKLRMFAEQIVFSLYHDFNLTKSSDENLVDLLTNPQFKDIVPSPILDRLHLLRKFGNRAAHGGTGIEQDALLALEEAFKISQWLYLLREGGKKDDLPSFIPPPPGGIHAVSQAQLKREKREAIERLARQNEEIQSLLQQLEEERLQVKAAQKSSEELKDFVESGKQVYNELHFDEETTRRRIIDRMLVNAGWDVGKNGKSTHEVGQEVQVDHQPTNTGVGYADYVLWGEDGKPLAVIEAKKFSIDPEVGLKQAQLYADGLETKYAQRPFVFVTNGYEIQIWNDKAREPRRKIYGFYSKDSLQYLLFQRENKVDLDSIPISAAITDRLYQHEAIQRVSENFSSKKRKALIVQATGTGKTRVAVSLCHLLIRARWAKRILFLCDRIELRKQAHNVFKEFMPGEPRAYVTARTYKERDKRIYLATYPAMMKCFESFDVGFFDLIIADESHRSIYNRYRTLLQYFDAFLVGLTATPVDMIQRNTFQLFDCESQNPTAYYPYEQAVDDKYLVPFRVFIHTTEFLREGIKYSNLSAEQKEQLQDQDENPDFYNFNQSEIDKGVFNKDTNRIILRNLMEKGIREATQTHPGKSIIFARNHNHAVLLEELFNEMYPQYGGGFCRVIDTYDPRSEQLIDDLKSNEHELTIAISVDMLDTGIDIPEVVNLVFAKPVWSPVKFWQMIGRGTRLCKNLFGAGEDKKEFFIFDHWGNFERFDVAFKTADAGLKKSLMQQVFDARITLAETALKKADLATFHMAIQLIEKDVNALPDSSIPVRDKWRQVKMVANAEVLKQFDAKTVSVLKDEIAPLMQWRQDVSKKSAAYKFDLLIARMQQEKLNESAAFGDLKDDLLNQVEQLKMNLAQVQAKASIIQAIKTKAYWEQATIRKLETLREDLRGIMQFRQGMAPPSYEPPVIDVMEDESKVQAAEYRPRKLEGVNMAAYKRRVEEILKKLFDANPVLQKIKAGKPVSEKDLHALQSLVLTQNPGVNLDLLMEFWPDTAGHLDFAIRRIIGLDGEAVDREFKAFINSHKLNSTQLKFLDMLKNHIRLFGAVELEQLYEQPFITLDSDGVDGVFQDENQIDQLFHILDRFKPQAEGLRPQA